MIDGRRRRYLAAIVILACLLFNAPLVIVVDRLGEGGFLPTYLMLAWGVVIGLAALVLRQRPKH